MALIKCPDCSTEVSNIAAACVKCGYPLQSKQRRKNTTGRGGILTIAGLIFVLAIVGTLGGHGGSSSSATGSSVEPPSQVLGQDRHLQNPGATVVLLALTRDDLDRLVRALAVNDKQGFENLGGE